MQIDIPEVIVQAVAFCIVFAILKWKAFGPIQKALAARRDKIKNDFDRIEQAKMEVEQLKSNYQSELQKIDDTARKKIQEAVEEGRRIAKDLQEKSRQDAEEHFEKMKDNIVLETAKARITLRREIADLAVLTTEKVMGEKLTGAKQQEKILEMIQDLEKSL